MGGQGLARLPSTSQHTPVAHTHHGQLTPVPGWQGVGTYHQLNLKTAGAGGGAGQANYYGEGAMSTAIIGGNDNY